MGVNLAPAAVETVTISFQFQPDNTAQIVISGMREDFVEGGVALAMPKKMLFTQAQCMSVISAAVHQIMVGAGMQRDHEIAAAAAPALQLGVIDGGGMN